LPFRSAADRSFKRRLESKSPKDRAAILECMVKLLEDPRQDGGLRSKKLRIRGEDVWYSRASRGNRVTWECGEGRTIIFRNLCDHDGVLRSP